MTPGNARSAEGTWEKLSQVAVKGAEYDSPERQPHPKCFEGTRVHLLDHTYELLDDRRNSRLIWLHGTAGVGKSAVAFTVAERMRDLKATQQTVSERRLAGTFFFSRKYTERCTTGYFFATLIYQLANNFPSILDDVNAAICKNPAILDPKKSLRAQMEALFLRPLQSLRFRLRDCPPLVFVIDALDECTSETEIADLISLLGQALREPDLPVTHILFTSRSQAHISEAIHEKEVYPLVCEIPVKTSGEGVTSLISLDGADVDNDIYIFLKHSFIKLRSRCSNFPQPTEDELARLASRAGRRFIVASTMLKFIHDGHSDPRDRLQLMLDLTSKLLPGTEVYKLYDHILSTCTDPKRAYLHLSVVAALANPLPISQISELLGPGQGRDVETVLVQLRSVMDIPADSSLPVNIYHSSVRDYALEASNCSLFEGQCVTPAHSLLARSSLSLMIRSIPESTGLLDALLELKRQCPAVQSHDPKALMRSLAFIVEPLQPLQVLKGLLWTRGYCSSELQSWVETRDGHAWLQTQSGLDWLRTRCGLNWLQTHGGYMWLRQLTQDNQDWLQAQGGQDWLQTQDGQDWLQKQKGLDWLLQTPSCWEWLQTQGDWDWLQTGGGRRWLHTEDGSQQARNWGECLQSDPKQDFVHTRDGRQWLQSEEGREWLQGQSGQEWLQTFHGRVWQYYHAISVRMQIEEFSSTVEAVSQFMIIPEVSLFPTFQTIQQFKNLPDFLMFPAFLALTPKSLGTHASSQCHGIAIIEAMETFMSFGNNVGGRNCLASDTLSYACKNWAMHLSQAPSPWDDALIHLVKVFWDDYLLAWLECQWCLRGLRSCLAVLSEGQKLAKEHLLQV